jgi:hypothetical protein
MNTDFHSQNHLSPFPNQQLKNNINELEKKNLEINLLQVKATKLQILK